MSGTPDLSSALSDMPTPRVWSMLATIFGDLAQGPEDRIDGPVLTKLTEGMGIKPEAMRVALHRLRNEDWIDSIKSGRTASHALTARGRAESQAASSLIYSSIDKLPRDWQVAICETSEARDKDALTQAGFVQLAPRLYLANSLATAPNNTLTLTGKNAPDWVAKQCLPDGLTEEYSDFLLSLKKVSKAVQAGSQTAPLKRAILRCQLVHFWRRLVLRHPYLPPSLVGENWPGHLCRTEITRLLALLPRPKLAELG